MPYYMITGRYSLDSMKAMVENPQDREAGARSLVEAAGGTLHSFFFCFGFEDFLGIAEMPDDEAMASVGMALGASGAASSGGTTKLLTAKEAMSAMRKAQDVLQRYRPPVS